MAWLTGWGKRKSHVIVHATGTGTLYPVKIIVHKTTGTDSGSDVYVGTSVRDDFKDVRFTDDDGSTLLDFFMESFTSGSVATFWVEVADDLTSVDRTIYVYYSKSAETAIVSNAIAANIFQLREHKVYAGYNPGITFSIQASTRVQCACDWAGLGYGYMFLVVPRAWLNGKYLRFNWQGDKSGTISGYPWSVLIYDGIYLRSLNTDFPNDAGLLIKGSGLLQTVAQHSAVFGATTEDVLVSIAGTQDFCTIIFQSGDAWNTVSLTEDVDWLEVNTGSGGSGNLLTVHFATSSVNMEQTGTTGDYGLARQYVSPEPAHSTWGTEEAPPEEINVTDSGAGSEVVTIADAEFFAISESGIGSDSLAISDWITITDTAAGSELVYLLGEVLIDGLRLDHALKIRVSEPTNIDTRPVSEGLPRRVYLGKQGRTLEIDGWVQTVAELNTLSALADGAVHEIQLPTGSRVSVHVPEVKPVRPIEPYKYPYTIRAVERMD